MDWVDITVGISILFVTFYYWSTWTFNYWKSRGILGPSPSLLFGNYKDYILGKISYGEQMRRIYNDFSKESKIGVFIRRKPALMLLDPELTKDVLIKDFTIFTDRGLDTFDKMEPLSQNLLFLERARWRPLRNKLSPCFTSTKLKKMFHHLLECGEQLEEHLKKLVAVGQVVNCTEFTTKYTIDCIGSCVFGLQMNALTDENNEFREMGRELFTYDWLKVLKLRLQEGAPRLYSLLGCPILGTKETNFFMKIMLDMIDYRKNNQVVKHDLIDLIMEMRDNPDNAGDIELSDTFMAAQLYVFFAAGFETSATTMSNTLYELAQYPSIQDRLREEIKHELAKNNEDFTYETVNSMKYLDMVFKETLRKYPPGDALLRSAAEDYTFAGTKLTIPKGMQVIIPVLAIHRDSQIYPKPEVFDPERFTEEAIKARHPMHWLAFGSGPRYCIADRFANYQTKVGLIKILRHYKVDVCEKTPIPYVFTPHGFVSSSKDSIYLKISKVD